MVHMRTAFGPTKFQLVSLHVSGQFGAQHSPCTEMLIFMRIAIRRGLSVFHAHFEGLRVPPGALVWFRPSVTKYKLAKAFPRLQPGVFLGYELAPGCIWKKI